MLNALLQARTRSGAMQSRARCHARSMARKIALGLAGLLTAAGAAAAQDAVKPDQVYARSKADGPVKTYVGQVTEHTLDKVVLDLGSRQQTFEPARVERIQFGDVPPTFVDGRAYVNRGDHKAAADSYKLAAGQADARDVVRAAARLLCAEEYMKAGMQDAGAFALAREQAERFIQDYPKDRSLPRARSVQARATLLEGQPAAAAQLFTALYSEAPGGKPNSGYDARLCLRAGVEAVRAYLQAGDTLKVREISSGLAAAIDGAFAAAGEDPALQRDLEALRQETRLFEGYALLAGKNAEGARAFFQRQLEGDAGSAALTFGARLGLAEALLDLGQAREAQLEFARVSAIDYTDRDRTAQAMIGLAECALALSDKGAAARARNLARAVLDHYGDTISAGRARELLNS